MAGGAASGLPFPPLEARRRPGGVEGIVRLVSVGLERLGCLRGTASAGRPGRVVREMQRLWGTTGLVPLVRRSATLETTGVGRRDGARRRACVGGG